MSPEAVAYVAVHGTGTPLGDPIEVGALGAALGGGSRKQQQDAAPLVMGSNKASPHRTVCFLSLFRYHQAEA